jgi:aldose 1-epimerase
MLRLWMQFLFTVAVHAILSPAPALAEMKIETSPFGKLSDGTEVTRYRLTNSHGNHVSVMNFGATLMDVNVPDNQGRLANVNLSFDNLQRYVDGHPYFGATVGRCANRIGGAEFTIDGKRYELTKNHGKHILHGGIKNFSYQFWMAQTIQEADKVGVKFTLKSPAGDNGFPGNVTVHAIYTWNDANELTVVLEATTDAPTHLNLTNHSYFNLGGVNTGTAMDHVATIYCDEVLDVDSDLIPTGKKNSVDGSVFDFRKPTAFGDRVGQLPATKGYDHCYVVPGKIGTLRKAALVVDPDSGRSLEIETTQPGMQLYTANHLSGNEANAGHHAQEAFCMETQNFPNAPNIASFPSSRLNPGQTMKETTVHRFGVVKK